MLAKLKEPSSITDKEISRAVRYYYGITFLWSAFFATANWLFFWRLYLTNGGIGLVDAFCFLLGMLAEIPTGAIADRIGRRKTMIIGALLMGIGYAATGFAQNGFGILAGYLLYAVGSSFYSGADDAYMYDFLKTHGQSDLWETVARRKQLIRRIGNTLAVFIGGYLYILNVRLPSIVRGVTFLIMIIPLVRMKFMDSAQPASAKDATTTYIRHIWSGMRELLNGELLPVILLILFVQGVTASVFIGGILRPLMLERSGLPINAQANFIALISLPIIGLLLLPSSRKRVSTFVSAVICAALIVVGFALNLPAHTLVIALAGIALIHFGNYFIAPATSTLINHAVTSTHRATALSTANLLEDLGYVVIAPLIGFAADKGALTLVVGAILIVMIVAIATAVLFHRRQATLTDLHTSDEAQALA